MTDDQREIRRKKRVLEYAEKHGNIRTTCRTDSGSDTLRLEPTSPRSRPTDRRDR